MPDLKVEFDPKSLRKDNVRVVHSDTLGDVSYRPLTPRAHIDLQRKYPNISTDVASNQGPTPDQQEYIYYSAWLMLSGVKDVGTFEEFSDSLTREQMLELIKVLTEDVDFRSVPSEEPSC